MKGRELSNLAKRCRVPMHRACRQAGVAPSTPWRWIKQGQTPNPTTVRRLERAIFALAQSAGTVPVDLASQCREVLDRPADEPVSGRSPRDLIRSIRSDLRELEQVTGL